jgi:hypothetical protein
MMHRTKNSTLHTPLPNLNSATRIHSHESESVRWNTLLRRDDLMTICSLERVVQHAVTHLDLIRLHMCREEIGSLFMFEPALEDRHVYRK